jgi:hypothetical protein
VETFATDRKRIAAEHHVLYQYNIASTKNVFAGLIQVSLCEVLFRLLFAHAGPKFTD